VKLTVAVPPEQIVVEVAATVAVGNGVTEIVIEPDCGWLQAGVPEVDALIRLKVVFAE
jgi:hypothetical protein